jgi:hypothetical protein
MLLVGWDWESPSTAFITHRLHAVTVYCEQCTIHYLGAKIFGADPSAKMRGAEVCTCRLSPFNFDVNIRSAEMCNLNASYVDAEFRIYFLKIFPKECICELHSYKGLKNRPTPRVLASSYCYHETVLSAETTSFWHIVHSDHI